MGEFGNDWRQVNVPVLGLPEEGLGKLQLQIQLAGPGEIWIDDVQFGDLAFGPHEQRALLKTVYPARPTLDGGQVVQCLRILESYWPRFLFEHVAPLEEVTPLKNAGPAVARASQQPAAAPDEKPAEKPAEPKESAGFLGRIRDLVPERLRF